MFRTFDTKNGKRDFKIIQVAHTIFHSKNLTFYILGEQIIPFVLLMLFYREAIFFRH